MANTGGSNQYCSRVGFLDLLCLLFIGLKLADHIDWPWWQVMLPIVVELVGSFVFKFCKLFPKKLVESLREIE